MKTDRMTWAAAEAALEAWYTKAEETLELIGRLCSEGHSGLAEDRYAKALAKSQDRLFQMLPPDHWQRAQVAQWLSDGPSEDRYTKASRLRDKAFILWEYLGALRAAPPQFWDRLFLTYCELGDFQAGDEQARAAGAVISQLGHSCHSWALELAKFWESSNATADESQWAAALEAIRQRCPFNQDIDRAIRDRLILEESRLLRDLMQHPLPPAAEQSQPELSQEAEAKKRGRPKKCRDASELASCEKYVELWAEFQRGAKGRDRKYRTHGLTSGSWEAFLEWLEREGQVDQDLIDEWRERGRSAVRAQAKRILPHLFTNEAKARPENSQPNTVRRARQKKPKISRR